MSQGRVVLLASDGKTSSFPPEALDDDTLSSVLGMLRRHAAQDIGGPPAATDAFLRKPNVAISTSPVCIDKPAAGLSLCGLGSLVGIDAAHRDRPPPESFIPPIVLPLQPAQAAPKKKDAAPAAKPKRTPPSKPQPAKPKEKASRVQKTEPPRRAPPQDPLTLSEEPEDTMVRLTEEFYFALAVEDATAVTFGKAKQQKGTSLTRAKAEPRPRKLLKQDLVALFKKARPDANTDTAVRKAWKAAVAAGRLCTVPVAGGGSALYVHVGSTPPPDPETDSSDSETAAADPEPVAAPVEVDSEDSAAESTSEEPEEDANHCADDDSEAPVPAAKTAAPPRLTRREQRMLRRLAREQQVRSTSESSGVGHTGPSAEEDLEEVAPSDHAGVTVDQPLVVGDQDTSFGSEVPEQIEAEVEVEADARAEAETNPEPTFDAEPETENPLTSSSPDLPSSAVATLPHMATPPVGVSPHATSAETATDPADAFFRTKTAESSPTAAEPLPRPDYGVLLAAAKTRMEVSAAELAAAQKRYDAVVAEVAALGVLAGEVPALPQRPPPPLPHGTAQGPRKGHRTRGPRSQPQRWESSPPYDATPMMGGPMGAGRIPVPQGPPAPMLPQTHQLPPAPVLVAGGSPSHGSFTVQAGPAQGTDPFRTFRAEMQVVKGTPTTTPPSVHTDAWDI